MYLKFEKKWHYLWVPSLMYLSRFQSTARVYKPWNSPRRKRIREFLPRIGETGRLIDRSIYRARCFLYEQRIDDSGSIRIGAPAVLIGLAVFFLRPCKTKYLAKIRGPRLTGSWPSWGCEPGEGVRKQRRDRWRLRFGECPGCVGWMKFTWCNDNEVTRTSSSPCFGWWYRVCVAYVHACMCVRA